MCDRCTRMRRVSSVCTLCLSLYCLLPLLSELMGVLRVGSLNVNGFRDRVKQSLFSELLSLKQLHVCFLQETHSTDDMAADYGLWWKGDCFLSHGTNLSLGVAVLLAPSLKAAILSKSEVVPGCLLMVRASVFEHTFTFINVYAPNRGPDRVDFFSRLDQILQSVSSGETVVMGGDWNCTLDFVHDRNGEEPHPQSAAALGSIVSGFNLIDVWREKHPQVKQYTRNMAVGIVLLMVLVCVSLVNSQDGGIRMDCQSADGVVGRTTEISCSFESYFFADLNVIIYAVTVTKRGATGPVFWINSEGDQGDPRFNLPSRYDPSLQITNTALSDEGLYDYEVLTNRGPGSGTFWIRVTAGPDSPHGDFNIFDIIIIVVVGTAVLIMVGSVLVSCCCRRRSQTCRNLFVGTSIVTGGSPFQCAEPTVITKVPMINTWLLSGLRLPTTPGDPTPSPWRGH